MAFTQHHKLTETLDAFAQQFVLWAVGALGLEAIGCTGDGTVYEIALANDGASASGGASSSGEHPLAGMIGRRFTFQADPASAPSSGPLVECVTWQSPLTGWLMDELRGGERLLHATAAHQPMSVHELAEHLFAQYRVDGGHMHLGGCRLEDRPFLRLTFLNTRAMAGGHQLIHCFGTLDGQLVEQTLCQELELDQLARWQGRAPRIDEPVAQRWIQLTRQQCQLADAEPLPLIAATVVWCKYAEGKINFSIGAQSVELPFSGWGRLLADRRVLPPQYHCPLSGRASYHLAATDDGRVTVAEAIGTCWGSARRVLSSELLTCAVSGRQALPEFMQVCPITGETILSALVQVCSVCQQSVSPRMISQQKCSACRELVPVSKEDPAVARILDTYPRLDRLRTWKMAETLTAQILVGSSAWRRLLIVIDKQTLELLYAAAGSRLSSKWTPLTAVQRSEWTS